MPKYNSLVEVAFTVDHDFEDVEVLLSSPAGMLMVLEAMAKRLEYLRSNPAEAIEAFAVCDTIENLETVEAFGSKEQQDDKD